jgi:hypothetical protein
LTLRMLRDDMIFVEHNTPYVGNQHKAFLVDGASYLMFVAAQDMNRARLYIAGQEPFHKRPTRPAA